MPPDAEGSLEDILDAAQIVRHYIDGRTLQQYRNDVGLRSIVERQFIIIGEAVTRLRSKHPAIYDALTDAKVIIDFRNLLVHAYDFVDDDRVWIIAQRHLPILVSEVENQLRKSKPQT